MVILNKILFLDIDGVLNSEEHFKTRDPHCDTDAQEDFLEWNLDPLAIKRLNRLVTEINPTIVLSSSWKTYGLDAVNKALIAKGFLSMIYFSTRESVIGDRGAEIIDFVNKYNVQDYLVIDDDSGDIVRYVDEPQFVHTRWSVGIQDSHVDYMIDYFSQNEVKQLTEVSSGDSLAEKLQFSKKSGIIYIESKEIEKNKK